MKEVYPLSNGYAIATYPKDENIVCLSKKNCDEIFGVVDVEKMADEYIKDDVIMPSEKSTFIFAFLNGMELNKDKVFTAEDMLIAYRQGGNDGARCEAMCGDYDNTEDFEESVKYGDSCREEFIQSLQQPTEIDVEIVMRPASLVYKSNLVIEELDS